MKINKKQDVQPIDLLEQEPLSPVMLEEFFLMVDKVTVNMTSCTELEDEKDGEEEK